MDKVRNFAGKRNARLTQFAGRKHTAHACCVQWPRSVCHYAASGWRPGGGCRRGALLRGTACVYMVLTHTQDGFTALMCAAQEGHTDCLKALLEAGADKDAKSPVRQSG